MKLNYISAQVQHKNSDLKDYRTKFIVEAYESTYYVASPNYTHILLIFKHFISLSFGRGYHGGRPELTCCFHCFLWWQPKVAATEAKPPTPSTRNALNAAEGSYLLSTPCSQPFSAYRALTLPTLFISYVLPAIIWLG